MTIGRHPIEDDLDARGRESIPRVEATPGDQAFGYVDQTSADALVELSDDQDRREALIALGMARAEEFTWKRTAEETATGYRGFLR